jgi:hypothetical protein
MLYRMVAFDFEQRVVSELTTEVADVATVVVIRAPIAMLSHHNVDRLREAWKRVESERQVLVVPDFVEFLRLEPVKEGEGQ